jgi:spore maturation protein CgeB
VKVLVVAPGARWSTSDVDAGLRYGLHAHGAEVIHYRLDSRLEAAKSWLYASWRRRKADGIDKPTTGQALLQAGLGVLEQALRHAVDAVIVVSAIHLHPDVIVLLKRAGLRVFAVFTESPYDHEHERRIAALVDGCWTHERAMLPSFQAVNPHCWYLPHGWHPERHFVSARQVGNLPAHDVVFVGSGFPERVTFFNAIDWTGIDLGLYGVWEGLGLKPEVAACVRSGPVDNPTAASLYRRAKVGLNLYRRTSGYAADSLNPRAYELAACGVFSLSQHRRESAEKFGALVPTFTSAEEASALLRYWLRADEERAGLAAALPAAVAGDSWATRGAQVLRDMASVSRRRLRAEMETPSDAVFYDTPEDARPKRTSIPATAFPGSHWHLGGAA